MSKKLEKKDMNFAINNRKGKGLPITVVVTILIQLVAIVWWISAKARDNDFLIRRVDQLENNVAYEAEARGKVSERLTRIEERLKALNLTLDRVDRKLSKIF